MPLTVIRKFDCTIADTKERVRKKNELVGNLPMKDTFLCKESGYDFYNTSKYDFNKLLYYPDVIGSKFTLYLNTYSANVRDIIEKFDFDKHITR